MKNQIFGSIFKAMPSNEMAQLNRNGDVLECLKAWIADLSGRYWNQAATLASPVQR